MGHSHSNEIAGESNARRILHDFELELQIDRVIK